MKIEYLYPEFCNLYGDRGNWDYLKACLNPEAIETSITERPRFLDGGVSLVYLASMTERSQERILETLLPYREQIRSLASSGETLFFLTGNALELFCRAIRTEDGRELPALGLIDCCAERIYPKRANSLFLGRYGDEKIVGYTSRFSHLSGLREKDSLFKVEKGLGAAPGLAFEGIRAPGVFGSYLLGPLLPMNPPLTRSLLALLGVAEPVLAFEKEATEAYEIRCREYAAPEIKL